MLWRRSVDLGEVAGAAAAVAAVASVPAVAGVVAVTVAVAAAAAAAAAAAVDDLSFSLLFSLTNACNRLKESSNESADR